MTTPPQPRAILTWLWLGVAFAAVMPAFFVLAMVVSLYSIGWLHGFTRALAIAILIGLQVPLGIAIAWYVSDGSRSVWPAAATGTALAVGYAAIPETVSGVGLAIVLVPAGALALAIGTTLVVGIVTTLRGRDRA